MGRPSEQPANSGDSVIRTDALSRRFVVGPRRRRRTVDAVTDLTFEVARGERVAFIGPNGAGKSTSIKMLTGILRPSGGSASVLGLVPWEQRRTLAARIGTVFGQRSQLWAELPPLASYRVLASLYDLDDRALTARLGELGELLDATDLFEQPVRTLSLGQRMRCELVACLLHRPELLFLDEPTIGLDLLGKRSFRALLLRINDELGATILLTSHDAADLERVAERTVVVNHGRIVHDAPIAELRSGLLARKRIEVGLERPVPEAELARLLGPDMAPNRSSDTSFHVDVDLARSQIKAVIDHLLTALPVADLSVTEPPLEEIIGEIYERPDTVESTGPIGGSSC